jgi:hypothetical protein
MRYLFCGRALLMGAGIVLGVSAWAQQATLPIKQPATSFEMALTYDSAQANNVPGKNFWLQGGSVQVHGQFWHGLGVVADVAGLHTANIHGTGTELDMVTVTFGPRYTIPLYHKRLAAYTQTLVGESFGFNSVFPGRVVASDSANNWALQVGGGVNVFVSRHFAARAIEASWLRTNLPNATTNEQNNLRLGAGIVFRR